MGEILGHLVPTCKDYLSRTKIIHIEAATIFQIALRRRTTSRQIDSDGEYLGYVPGGGRLKGLAQIERATRQ